MKKYLIMIFMPLIALFISNQQTHAAQLGGSLNLYNESSKQLLTINTNKALKFKFQGDDKTSYSVVLTDDQNHIIAKALTIKTNSKQELFTVGLKKGDYAIKISLTDRDEHTHYYQLSYSTANGDFEQEYNDTLDTANKITFNKLYKGSADLMDPVHFTGADYFKFNLSKNSNVKLTLSKNNLAVLTAYIVDNNGEDIENRVISSNNKTLNANQTIPLKKGTYYIRITATQSNTPYSFKLSKSTIKNSEIEKNNTLKQANSIENKQILNAHLFSSSDLDYYKFTLKKKKNVTFHYALEQNQQLNMELMDNQNRNYHASTYTAKSNRLTKHTQVRLPPGTYYLKVSNASLKYNLMAYQLKIQY